MSDYLVVLTKQPLLGRAKTRLAQSVGTEQAQRLAEAFVLDTLELARTSGAHVLVAYTPSDAGPWFRERAPWAEVWAQPEVDFGQRLQLAARAAFERGATRCVLIGMDTPHLDPSVLKQAMRSLDKSSICLGPSLDGGYYLIGLREDHPHLFENVPWSTERVLSITRQRAREAGLSVHQLPPEFDIDDGSDLQRLIEDLRTHPTRAPATRAALPNPLQITTLPTDQQPPG